jgi:hypothetical protein
LWKILAVFAQAAATFYKQLFITLFLRNTPKMGKNCRKLWSLDIENGSVVVTWIFHFWGRYYIWSLFAAIVANFLQKWLWSRNSSLWLFFCLHGSNLGQNLIHFFSENTSKIIWEWILLF